MAKAIAFTGVSNSGKTTLIVKLIELLSSTHKVAVIKNDPKDKARFDVEGKDSYKFFHAGADVAVVSPSRTTYFSAQSRPIDDVIPLFGHFDYLFVEGIKTLPLPRLCIMRNQIHSDYFDYVQAVAYDDTIDSTQIPTHLTHLNLNNPNEILTWINIHAKEV